MVGIRILCGTILLFKDVGSGLFVIIKRSLELENLFVYKNQNDFRYVDIVSVIAH